MKVRIPQQNSQADMMRKLQQFQENSAKLEEELSEKEYDVTSGGGAVSVKIKGTKGQGCRITSGAGNCRESATETFRRNG